MNKRKTKTKRIKLTTNKLKPKLKPKPSKVQQIDIVCNDPFTKCLGYIGHLHGLKKIILSPKAQKFVGCRIGHEITALTPWILVKADRIRESIRLYENTSDFCSIKPFMERYLEPDVLVGCYNVCYPDQEQEFYICTTRRAKDEVIKILRKERKDIMTNVYNTFCYDTMFWETAHENDVVKKKHYAKRHSLYEVEVNLPIAPAKRKLSTRTVQDAVDGYVEFPPNHEKHKTVMRRRIDNSVQTKKKVNQKTNTIKKPTKNMISQCDRQLDNAKKICVPTSKPETLNESKRKYK